MNKDLSQIIRLDVEIQSICNRQCAWCPNATIDRHSQQKIMSDKTFSNLLNQLRDANFGKGFFSYELIEDDITTKVKQGTNLSFMGYQEPFYDYDLFKKRLIEAKDILGPKISYSTASNGDLITKDKLESLPLTTLQIEDYDCKGIDYWTDKLLSWGAIIINYDEIRHRLEATHRYINSIAVLIDWPKHVQLQNRGGYFSPGDLPNFNWDNQMEKRNFPCIELDHCISICYDGSVMPCCHMQCENPFHKEYILGNINDTPLLDIFYSEKAENLRKKLKTCDFPPPCQYCQKRRSVHFIEINKQAEEYTECHRLKEPWTKTQEFVWNHVLSYQKRFLINGVPYPNSFYNKKYNSFQKEKYKILFENYYFNLELLKNFYQTINLNSHNLDLFEDIYGDITFDHFSFSSEKLEKELIEHKGFYQPFLGLSKRKKNKIAINAGRHRLKALQNLKKENKFPDIAFSCFILDAHKDYDNIWLSVPRDLYQEFLVPLNLQIKKSNINDYIQILVHDAVTIWIIMKMLEHEIDFIVEYYYNDLIKNNILPSSIINFKLNDNK